MSRDPVDVVVPGDKSITHRALILAALASGDSRLDGLLDAADTRATAAALRALGIDVGSLAGPVRIRGAGPDAFRTPAAVLDCANSGTTARLLLGLLSGCAIEATLDGDASLRSRPMRRVTGALAASGAVFQELGEPDRLPIRVRGVHPLNPIRWDSPHASAQVKSALLLAGITGGTSVEASEPLPSRDHTERMLRAAGVEVRSIVGPGGHTVHMEPPSRLEPLDLTVPGDVSAAVPLLCLGALVAPVRVAGVGINPTRTAALRVMERMGAAVALRPAADRQGEPTGEVVVGPGELVGTRIGADEVPALLDEVPVLAALAARARGETRFDGIGELRVKESDRVATTVRGLRAVGVEADAGPAHLVVQGREGPLAGVVDAAGDHRIAMAFGMLGSVPGNRIQVHGGDAVDISFPDFWNQLQRLNSELHPS